MRDRKRGTMSRKVRSGQKPGITGLLIFGLAVCSVASGCLTSDLSKQDPPTVVMEMDRPEANPLPLPARIPIRERVYQGGKILSDRVVFLGWDFNQDSQIDMLEVLDRQGAVRERVYDFNLDGTPDMIVQVKDGLPPLPPGGSSKAPAEPTAPPSGQ